MIHCPKGILDIKIKGHKLTCLALLLPREDVVEFRRGSWEGIPQKYCKDSIVSFRKRHGQCHYTRSNFHTCSRMIGRDSGVRSKNPSCSQNCWWLSDYSTLYKRIANSLSEARRPKFFSKNMCRVIEYYKLVDDVQFSRTFVNFRT